jgi:CRISPR-associated endonuclease/helicase Cas3
MSFEDFFRAITGFAPFSWQRRLADEVTHADAERVVWPDVCALPTAAGKTSLLLIAYYALAIHPRAHRRIAYVIDRRIVADEAFRLADRLRERLREPDLAPFLDLLRATCGVESAEPVLETHLLRGGIGEPLARLTSPVTPTIMVGTVDQLGSRLLFRGYGVSERMRPIAAGLLSYDTLWILDEAHLSHAFLETLRTVQRTVMKSPLPHERPIHAIEVSATPRIAQGRVFKLGVLDEAIRPRIEAKKPVRLIAAPPAKTHLELVELVAAALREGRRRIGVIVNRVGLARAVFKLLEKRLASDDIQRLLFIGPIREYDRERLYATPAARALAAHAADEFESAVVAICTQTVEVGADLDFDALFVQVAPLDVLRQRFGRLDRLGRRKAVDGAVVYESEARQMDAIYGRASDEAVVWLQSIASDGVVDFGVATLGRHVEKLDAAMLERLCTARERGEPLHEQHQRNLLRTTDTLIDEPDVAIFLHGASNRGDVQVIWRADLDPGAQHTWKDRVAAAPPCTRETLTVPLYAAREFLRARPADVVDVPLELDLGDHRPEETRCALRWDSDEERVCLVGHDDLRSGDTIVVPSVYGGADHFGWAPGSTEPVEDLAVKGFIVPASALADMTAARAVRVCVSLDHAGDPDLTLDERVDGALERLVQDESQDPIYRACAQRLRMAPRRRRTIIELEDAARAWVGWRRSLVDEDELEADASSFTRTILLLDHLRHVEDRARKLGAACGLSAQLVDLLARAGLVHDIGKADERFQAMLRGGDLIAALTQDSLAKGLRRYFAQRVDVPPSERWRRGMRHEAISTAMLPTEDPLVRHLVASHHGYGRPTFPAIEDRAPRLVRFAIGDRTFEGESDHRLGARAWDEEFARLIDRYGAWGLAYLEAILRLTDHRCSREEEEGVADAA